MLSCACFWSTNTLTHTELLFILSANTRVWGRFPTTWCNETFLQNYNTLGQVRAAAKCPEYSRRTPRGHGFSLECGEISTLSSEMWHRSLSALFSGSRGSELLSKLTAMWNIRNVVWRTDVCSSQVAGKCTTCQLMAFMIWQKHNEFCTTTWENGKVDFKYESNAIIV